MPIETQALTLHAMTIPPGQRGRRLISTGGVARIAGCDTATVRRAIFRGELQALRLGKRGDYPIPVNAVAEWLRPASEGEQ